MRNRLGKRLLILGASLPTGRGVIALAGPAPAKLSSSPDADLLLDSPATSPRPSPFAGAGGNFHGPDGRHLANRPERFPECGGGRVTVILPDMAAGCSMADMAMIDQVENCWSELGEVIDTDDITPVTYVNSAASLKAFCGKHGGIVCTSSNAAAVLAWAFSRTRRRAVLSRPAHGPKHRVADGNRHRRDAGLESTC